MEEQRGGRARVALLHHTGGGNLGDDASLVAVLRNIGQRWPEAEIATFTMNPERTAELYGIPSYPLKRHRWEIGYRPSKAIANKPQTKLFRWLRNTRMLAVRLPRAFIAESSFMAASRQLLKSSDVLVLCGGGQLTERSGAWGFPYTVFTWFVIAKSVGTRCIVLNVGAGPLRRFFGKLFVLRALRLADYVSFRDKESQSLVQSIGFKGNTVVFPDNVYSLQVPVQPQSASEGKPIVGMAPMQYPVDPPFDAASDKVTYQALIAKFATFASALVSRSCVLEFFGTDVSQDPDAVEDLRSVLQSDHGVTPSPFLPVSSVDDLLSRMSAMDYVVTCRFHGVVFAHLLNKPVIAISPHPKVKDLMNALGLSKYCVDIRTFEPHALAQIFDDLVQHSDFVKAQMAESLASYQDNLRMQFDGLFPPHPEKFSSPAKPR